MLRTATRASQFVICIVLLQASVLQAASNADAVMSKWQPVNIDFGYLGTTTFYSCNSLEWKLETLLKSIGAHEKTRVTVTGCDSSGPSRHAFVHISGGIPVPANQVAEPTREQLSKQALIKRLGVAPTLDQTEFPATRKTIDLSQGRAAVFEAGDCELMEQLARNVLPKLGTTTVDTGPRCFPGHAPLTTPPFKVNVLTKLRSADEPAKSR